MSGINENSWSDLRNTYNKRQSYERTKNNSKYINDENMQTKLENKAQASEYDFIEKMFKDKTEFEKFDTLNKIMSLDDIDINEKGSISEEEASFTENIQWAMLKYLGAEDESKLSNFYDIDGNGEITQEDVQQLKEYISTVTNASLKTFFGKLTTGVESYLNSQSHEILSEADKKLMSDIGENGLYAEIDDDKVKEFLEQNPCAKIISYTDDNGKNINISLNDDGEISMVWFDGESPFSITKDGNKTIKTVYNSTIIESFNALTGQLKVAECDSTQKTTYTLDGNSLTVSYDAPLNTNASYEVTYEFETAPTGLFETPDVSSATMTSYTNGSAQNIVNENDFTIFGKEACALFDKETNSLVFPNQISVALEDGDCASVLSDKYIIITNPDKNVVVYSIDSYNNKITDISNSLNIANSNNSRTKLYPFIALPGKNIEKTIFAKMYDTEKNCLTFSNNKSLQLDDGDKIKVVSSAYIIVTKTDSSISIYNLRGEEIKMTLPNLMNLDLIEDLTQIKQTPAKFAITN